MMYYVKTYLFWNRTYPNGQIGQEIESNSSGRSGPFSDRAAAERAAVALLGNGKVGRVEIEVVEIDEENEEV